MAKDDRIQKWLLQVDEDISSAECLFRGGHWLYTGFLAHQAIEKVLKAYWIATQDDEPPFTHSHTRLLKGSGLMDRLTPDKLRFIALMEPLYIEARYPEHKAEIAKMLNENSCQYIIDETKQLLIWIKKHLPKDRS